MRHITIAGLLAVAVLNSGCNWLAHPLYLIAPKAPEKKVTAEFAGLPHKTVAVVVYADMDTLYEYPYAREGVTAAIARQLDSNVQDVEVIEPGQVIRYQDANVSWRTHPFSDVGQALGADYVLYVSLSEFSTHESGSVNLPVGRVSAGASLWDAHADPTDPEACVWRKINLAIKVDATTGVMAWDQSILLIQMQRVFAERLVKCFYDHREPRDSSGGGGDDLGVAGSIR